MCFILCEHSWTIIYVFISFHTNHFFYFHIILVSDIVSLACVSNTVSFNNQQLYHHESEWMNELMRKKEKKFAVTTECLRLLWWWNYVTLCLSYTQWLRYNRTQGNAVPLPPIYGSKHPPALDCYSDRWPKPERTFTCLDICTFITGYAGSYFGVTSYWVSSEADRSRLALQKCAIRAEFLQ